MFWPSPIILMRLFHKLGRIFLCWRNRWSDVGLELRSVQVDVLNVSTVSKEFTVLQQHIQRHLSFDIPTTTLILNINENSGK